MIQRTFRTFLALIIVYCVAMPGPIWAQNCVELWKAPQSQGLGIGGWFSWWPRFFSSEGKKTSAELSNEVLEAAADFTRQLYKLSEHYGLSTDLSYKPIVEIRKKMQIAMNRIVKAQNALHAQGLQKYRVTGLRRLYFGETIGMALKSNFAFIVSYTFEAKERDQLKIFFKDGLAYYSMDPTRLVNERGRYVMDGDGQFYFVSEVNNPRHLERVSHSTLLGGMPVASAGMMDFHNGKLVYVDRDSGHYAPSKKLFQQAVDELRDQGARLDRTTINDKY